MPPNVEAFVDLAVIQAGDRYRFGAEVSADDPDPDEWDCSELIEWLGARLRITPKIPDGSWIQYRHCHNHGTTITPAKGLATRGALLFRFSSDPLKGGRPSSSHVAISLGDNRTVEARSTSAGVGVFGNAGARVWTHAALVPGLAYTRAGEAPAAWAAEAWAEAVAAGLLEDRRPGDPVTRQELAAVLTRRSFARHVRRLVG